PHEREDPGHEIQDVLRLRDGAGEPPSTADDDDEHEVVDEPDTDRFDQRPQVAHHRLLVLHGQVAPHQIPQYVPRLPDAYHAGCHPASITYASVPPRRFAAGSPGPPAATLHANRTDIMPDHEPPRRRGRRAGRGAGRPGGRRVPPLPA